MVSVILSYSTLDENGEKYCELLADDLSKIYCVEVHAYIKGYDSQLIGGLWIEKFKKKIPDCDYYILVVTESFINSKAKDEFDMFKNCLNTCTGICGRRKDKGDPCNLKAIIPCFFISPDEIGKKLQKSQQLAELAIFIKVNMKKDS